MGKSGSEVGRGYCIFRLCQGFASDGEQQQQQQQQQYHSVLLLAASNLAATECKTTGGKNDEIAHEILRVALAAAHAPWAMQNVPNPAPTPPCRYHQTEACTVRVCPLSCTFDSSEYPHG